jgi:hypothetical protein
MLREGLLGTGPLPNKYSLHFPDFLSAGSWSHVTNSGQWTLRGNDKCNFQAKSTSLLSWIVTSEARHSKGSRNIMEKISFYVEPLRSMGYSPQQQSQA